WATRSRITRRHLIGSALGSLNICNGDCFYCRAKNTYSGHPHLSHLPNKGEEGALVRGRRRPVNNFGSGRISDELRKAGSNAVLKSYDADQESGSQADGKSKK